METGADGFAGVVVGFAIALMRSIAEVLEPVCAAPLPESIKPEILIPLPAAELEPIVMPLVLAFPFVFVLVPPVAVVPVVPVVFGMLVGAGGGTGGEA